MSCSEKCRPKPPQRTRPRVFDAKSSARAYCAAKRKGMTHRDFMHEVKLRCGTEEDCDCERLKTLLRLSVSAMALAAATITAVVLSRNPIIRLIILILGRRALEDLRKRVTELEDLSNIIEGELEEAIQIRPPESP